MIETIKLWLGIYPIFGGFPRSPLWSAVRKQHLKKFPACAVCGKESTLLKPVEVHHCIPYSVDAKMELRMENLITLCRPDHLLFGHLNSFQSFNKKVREDAKIMRNKIKSRP
jgi:hypothetical protein